MIERGGKLVWAKEQLHVTRPHFTGADLLTCSIHCRSRDRGCWDAVLKR